MRVLFSPIAISLLLSTTPNPGNSWSVITNHRPLTSLTTPRLRPTKLFSQNPGNDNNVVLRPSSAPEAFDSFKIGTARVHRYASSSAADDGTNYVMWYHGRSAAADEDNGELPPLSTGRIGRATSRNGLAWEKQMDGSPSEDHPNVSLGLNKESWWGFDTAHVGLGQVLLPLSTPAVVAEGGVYLMYYMGGNFEETKVSEYMPGGEGGEVTVKGMKMKIGVAVSQDGNTWGRVEGDDPSGACVVPFDKGDVNQGGKSGGSGGEVEEELYVGWPEVVVDVVEGEDEDSKFYMFYSTMTKEGKEKAIACAVSPDGFRWEKKGVCLRPSQGEEDAAGCARCNVVKDAIYDVEKDDWVYKPGGGWTMFYEGVAKEDGKHRIMRAVSKDGFQWTKTGVVLDVGQGDDWDCNGVGSPSVLRMDDGSIRMYYTGVGPDQTTAVGIAKTIDEDGVGFEREQAQFTFTDKE